jgi:hypothetical protein
MQYTTNTFAPIELLCDNDALVKKVKKLRKSTRPEFPNDTLAPSWDVLQRITKNLRKFREEESSLRWIPSHQDDKTPIEQIPLDARLNVRADKLAGQFQQQSPHHQHDFDPPMIEGARCHLVINDYVTESKHKHIARDVLREKAIFRYMQTKYKWTDTTIQGINWAGHKQAVSSWTYAHHKECLTKSPPTFLRKFLHGWLATGKMVARYNATLYPKECQSCQHPVEDQTHFLRYNARSDWQNKFRDSLRKHSTTADTDPLYNNNISYKPRNNDIGWITGHIALIWNEPCSAWKLRNNSRHGKEEELQRQIRLDQVKRQIRVRYQHLQPLCNLTNHRKWFYANPEEHLFLREPSLTQLQNWVTTYEPMIRARPCIQQQLNQQAFTAIDEAFEHANSLGP